MNTTLTANQLQVFKEELMNLMLCRELGAFVSNHNEYANEPDDYLDEIHETLCDPSFENCTSWFGAEDSKKD